MQKIRPNIYVELSSNDVMVGAIVSEAGIVCIDAPSAPDDATNWQRKLLQLDSGPILAVVYTDHNRARVLGNHWLQAPTTIAHEITSQLMKGHPEVWGPGSDLGRSSRQVSGIAGARTRLPQITFTNKTSYYCGSIQINLLHCPGCHQGSTWVWLPKQKVIFTGDSVFQDTHPVLAGAQLDDWINSLKLLNQPTCRDHIIVPGRSKPTDRSGLQFSLEYLRYLYRRLKAWKSQGRPSSSAPELAGALLDRFPVAQEKQADFERGLREGLEDVFVSLRV